MAEILSMGGYAAFVWPAFGVTAVVMVILLITSLRELRTNQAALDGLEHDIGPRRRRRKAADDDA